MNRRGTTGEQISTLGVIFILILIIAAGISFGIISYFGSGYDFSYEESTILSNNIQNCISNNAINQEFFDNFYKNCRLNQQVIENNHRIKICEGMNEKDCIESSNSLFAVGSNFIGYCGLSGTKENSNYAPCAKNSFSSNGKTYTILTVSDHRGANGGGK